MIGDKFQFAKVAPIGSCLKIDMETMGVAGESTVSTA